VTSSLVIEAAIWVKLMYRPMIKIVIENQRKHGNWRNFYINLHLKDRLEMEFTACWSQLMPERALTSFTVCTYR